MRVLDQPAYILHQRPFRDSSRIVDIFSRDYGRLSVLSRGSRSAKSRIKGLLQPFQTLLLSWSGRGEMPTLSQVDSVASQGPGLKGNALSCGFYINELIMRLLHKHDVHEEIFHLYQNTLYSLANCDDFEPELRLFEKSLLQYLGFGLNLDVDADSGDAVKNDYHYHYFIEHGPIRVEIDRPNEGKLFIRGYSLLRFQANDLSEKTVRRDIKSLMRYVLSYYLGHKPLKSRELFR